MRYYSKRYKRRHTPALLERKKDHAMYCKAASGIGVHLKQLFSAAAASIAELQTRLDRGEFKNPEPTRENEYWSHTFPLLTVPKDPDWTEPEECYLEETEECGIIASDINVPKVNN